METPNTPTIPSSSLTDFAAFMAGETIRLENEGVITAASSPDLQPEPAPTPEPSSTEIPQDGTIMLEDVNVTPEEAAESIVEVLETFHTLVYPYLHRKATFSDDDYRTGKALLKQFKAQKGKKSSVTDANDDDIEVIEYTEADIELVERIVNYKTEADEYKESLPYSKDERKRLVARLAPYLRGKGVNVSPAGALIMMLGVTEGVRLAPILMKIMENDG